MIYKSILSIITLLLCIYNIQCLNTLDISDFKFYYKTYYYNLDSSQSETSTYYNKQLQLNITINFSSNTIKLISNNDNNIIKLNALPDNNWDEISTINLIQNNNILSDNKIFTSSRSLLSACAGAGGSTGAHSSKCSKIMQRMRMIRRRKQARLAQTKSYKQRQRMRDKWKQRLRRIRRRKDTKLKMALRHLRRKEENAGDEFGWIADVLQRKTKYRRRIIDENNIISFCKVMNKFEICFKYFMDEQTFLSFEIKFGEKKMLKTAENNGVNYRYLRDIIHDRFGKNGQNYLDFMIHKYETMDWHGFEFEGIMNGLYEYNHDLNGLIHYFDEYELDIKGSMYGNDTVECGMIEDVSVEMCMKIVQESGNLLLYFEKDGLDLEMGNGWKNVYSFNSEDWDEINVIYGEDNDNWVRKCSNKLIIAKLCVEQFDEDYYSAIIKFKSADEKGL